MVHNFIQFLWFMYKNRFEEFRGSDIRQPGKCLRHQHKYNWNCDILPMHWLKGGKGLKHQRCMWTSSVIKLNTPAVWFQIKAPNNADECYQRKQKKTKIGNNKPIKFKKNFKTLVLVSNTIIKKLWYISASISVSYAR